MAYTGMENQLFCFMGLLPLLIWRSIVPQLVDANAKFMF